MQNGLAWNWTYLTWCTVSSDTLEVTPIQQRNHAWRNFSAVNTVQYTSVRYHLVMKVSFQCNSDDCSVPGEHSAGCRTSWVHLQHHATVVTSNGVTICDSKFPPTVSKHCQHQHCTITKTVRTIWNTNKPRCCDTQGAASSVQHHGSLCTQPQQTLLWCLSRPANIRKS